MRRWLIVILIALGAGFWLGRLSFDEVAETFFPTSPHEAYRHALTESPVAGTAMVRRWLQAATTALDSAPTLPAAPFQEAGYLDPSRQEAVAYRFPVRAGQRLRVRVELEPPSDALLFLDLFRVSADADEPPERVESADSARREIEYEPRRDGVYIVRIQPELLRGGRYMLTASAGPTLSFPVDGAGVGSIRSFFGAERDGGSRSHHGVDIFAPRGTPVLAATAGRVRSVRETPRGGRVVWLRDERRGQSLYYAHLERQLVRPDQRVEPGDTLGLVGNSGNARTTPPHLHFGIYRRGEGPVDPLPFVRPVPAPTPPGGSLDALGEVRSVTVDGGRVRAAPDPAATITAELDRHVPVQVLATTGDWYRVRLPDGRIGFMAGSLIGPSETLRREALASRSPLRDRPAAAGARIAMLEPGDEVEVLGRFNQHLYVRYGGREAWLETPAAP